MPLITATGSGRCEFGPNTACFISKQRARNNVLANLRAAAIRRCPNGYTITAGPNLTLTLNCDHQWNGWWPDINSSYSATATIVCNRSGQHPEFSTAQSIAFADQMQEAISDWSDHFLAVKESYELLSALSTTDKLVAYLEEKGAKAALAAVNEAREKGLVANVVPPAIKTFLERPSYGELLYHISNTEGISAIEQFQIKLENVEGCPPCSEAAAPESGGGSRVVNINISL